MSKEEQLQGECHIELASFADLARMACAYHQHPRRVYSFERNGVRVAAITMILTNTLVVMYAPLPKNDKSAKYIAYKIDSTKKESCSIAYKIANGTSSAPIIHLKSNITHLGVANTKDEIPNLFNPIELKDIGSLARLTYDPDFPEEPELTLYAVPVDNGLWAIGYIIMYEMDEVCYEFYHVMCEDEKQIMPFLRYRHDREQEPEFTDMVEHGYTYMPVVKLKKSHPIFGFYA